MTIPIEGSMLYVEPVYLKASNENSLPEVKRVIVSYGDRIAYEETLDEALIALFGVADEGVADEGEADYPKDTPIGGDLPGNIRDLIKNANDIFNAVQESQRAGNWRAYGDNIDELQRIMDKLNLLNTIEGE